MSELPHPFRVGDDGVRVALRVQPRAASARIEGIVTDADGGSVLKVRITAAPEDGRANEAVIGLLAKAWRMPKSSFRIVVGARGRAKTVLIAGEPEILLKKLDDWIVARND